MWQCTPIDHRRPNAAEAAAITTIHVSIFILHFILPMSILALASNCNDAVLSSIGFSAIIDYASSSIPVQTKPGDSLDMNVRLEQRESTQTNSKTMHNKKENVQKQQQQQQQQQQQRKKQQKRQESRPNSPQSSELYKNMESQISQLKTVYQSSLNNPDEIISAIRYTDYLKYRDATIHHGGMYQMETIETY